VRSRLLSIPQLLALFVIVIGVSVLVKLTDDARVTYALYQQVQMLEQQKASMEAEVKDMNAQIAAMSKPGWAEQAVREWLRWVRPGETLLVLTSPVPDSLVPHPSADSLADGAPSRWQVWLNYLLGLDP